jgi:Protein of unknown function (DUF993)
MQIQLPSGDGTLVPFNLLPAPPEVAPSASPRFNRLAYAAAHVVALPGQGSVSRARKDQVDWDATLRFRHHLWRLGFGIAEAMDTAQREILGWETASHLLNLVLREAKAFPGRRVIGGAGTDHLATSTPSIAQIVDAYVFQAEFIHSRGGRVILFPTALLPKLYPEPKHYAEVYRSVAKQVSKPVFVHWLGDMFAPALKGYFPGNAFWDVMADNPKLLGVKVSLLDQAVEEGLRQRLEAQGQIVLTGDDFNFPPLIEGHATKPSGTFEFEGERYPLGGYSHALLGIFDGIATVASKAMLCLAEGNTAEYRRLLEPTVPLSRHIFQAPTQYYKAGLVFLAYLNGHQDRFHLMDDLERQRSIVHYAELFRLANVAGVLDDPQQAYDRFLPLLHSSGF